MDYWDFIIRPLKEFGEIIDWEEIILEGYCIINKDCKAAKLTNANTDLTAEDVKAYAMMAEKMFQLPIFYLEYSGKYGDVDLVADVKKVLKNTTLILWRRDFYSMNKRRKWQSMRMSSLSAMPFMKILIKHRNGIRL